MSSHNITEPVVFEWKNLPGHTTMQLLQEIQTMMENEIQVLPSDSKARIILLDIDIDWTQKSDEDTCRRNSSCASAYVRCFLAGT